MDTFKERLPSTQELFLVFSACAFPVYVWSIINTLQEVPAWILRLSMWDLVGTVAYTQFFALIESIAVFLIVVLLALVLPASLFKKKFVAQGSMLVLLSAVWFVLAHYNDQIIGSDQLRQLVFWFAVYVSSLVIFYVLIQRYKKVEDVINLIANKLTVLSSVYVIVGCLSALIVIARNI